MAIALSQTLAPVKDDYTRLSSTHTKSASFPSPPATGELIVVRGYGRFYTPNQAAESLVVTDNKGNTYSVVKQTELDDDPDDEFFAWVAWCVHSGSGSGTHTITWYLNTGTDTDYHYRGYWAAHSYSSNGWSSPLDKSLSNNSSTPHTSLAITTGTLAQAAELLVAVWGGYQWDDLDLNVVPPSGWTNRHLVEGEAANLQYEASSMDDLIVSAATSQTVTYSHDTQTYAAMVVLSFKESPTQGRTVSFTSSTFTVAPDSTVNATVRVMSGGVPVAGVQVTCVSNDVAVAQVLDDVTPPPASVVMTCVPGATQLTTPYQSDNNTWGAGSVGTEPWSQCCGISTMQTGNKVNFRTTWLWPDVGSSAVKAYPEIIYGQKPGHAEVGDTLLPIKIDDIVSCTASWDGLTETMVGARGQFTFDLWLQSSPVSNSSFYAAPKTHEVMLPISAYGNPQYGVPPNRNPAWLVASNVTVDGRATNIYDTGGANFGDSNNPWRFVVYQPLSLSGGAITSATVDWRAIFTDMKNRGICTGQEYLVSIEIGVEPIFGQGDSLLTGYKVVVT